MECCKKEKIYDLLIIGAGPVGIESAAAAKQSNMETIVLEQGNSVGYNLEKHSHLEMFSPWYYNYSPLGVTVLKDLNIFQKPKNSFQTSKEYIKDYLLPLSKAANINIEYNTKVERIGKKEITKTNLMGENRKKFPFRVLAQKEGKEIVYYAWNIIDSSGVYDRPLPLGMGRVEALNERKLKEEIYYQAIDNLDKNIFTGKKTLVLGQTCCTAKSIEILSSYSTQDNDTKIIYIDETGLKPYIHQLKNDIFKKRVELIESSNEFLDSPSPNIQVKQKCGILGLEKSGNGFRVTLVYHNNDSTETIYVDNIVSNCGFSPDNSIYKELQIHECYGSFSPMNLASAMLEDTIDYSFTKNSLGIQTLKNPEPNFFILGSKSYGRNQGFSIFIGIAQIAELFAHISNKSVSELLNSPLEEHNQVQYIKEKPKEVLSTQKSSSPSRIIASKEAKYKTITENLQEIIFETDLKQKITYLSPSWEKLTGFRTDEFMGLDWQELLHEDSKEQGVCQCNAFMSKELDNYNEEFKIRCKDGRIKWVEVNASVLIDKNGVAFGTIGSMVDITERVMVLNELKEKNKILDELAIRDSLTGVYNRRYFDETIIKEFERGRRDNSHIALVMCDIDYFKQYNDTYGHQKGDDVIKEVSKALAETFSRKIDIVARYGGEEFVVILNNIELSKLKELLENTRQKLKELAIEHSQSKVSNSVTLSFGAFFGKTSSFEKSDEILYIADEELYKSKEMGRNRINIKSFE